MDARRAATEKAGSIARTGDIAPGNAKNNPGWCWTRSRCLVSSAARELPTWEEGAGRSGLHQIASGEQIAERVEAFAPTFLHRVRCLAVGQLFMLDGGDAFPVALRDKSHHRLSSIGPSETNTFVGGHRLERDSFREPAAAQPPARERREETRDRDVERA